LPVTRLILLLTQHIVKVDVLGISTSGKDAKKWNIQLCGGKR